MSRPRIPILAVDQLQDKQLDRLIAGTGFKSFESFEKAASRQQKMLKRLSRVVDKELYSALAARCLKRECDPKSCFAACHHATRLHRAEVIHSETELFRRIGGEFCFFTVLPPQWQVDHDALHDFSPSNAARLITSALRNIAGMKLASFNVEITLYAEGDRQFWGPHVHGISCGPDNEGVSKGLNGLIRGKGFFRPVHTKMVKEECLPILLGYMTKRVDHLKVRYERTADGKFRLRQGLPLRGDMQGMLDEWRHQFAVDAFHHRVGFKQNGGFLVLT